MKAKKGSNGYMIRHCGEAMGDKECRVQVFAQLTKKKFRGAVGVEAKL